MTYIGSVGDRTTVSFVLGSVIVAVVSAVVFLPWGVASRLAGAAATPGTPSRSERRSEATG
ncbi:MAG TPA: hypothetical protein VFN57_15335 [Thermomicrobiaceae bacterium]|nr:hypothetical protein [Thermomicrobiaceae bacterium]